MSIRYVSILLSLFIAFFVVLSGGCAKTPLEMHFGVTSVGSTERVWPGLPEIPRYRYAGELTGEDNFRPVEGSRGEGVRKVLRWLVGLGAKRADRMILQRPQSGTVDTLGRIFVTDISRAGVFVFDPIAGQLEVWDRAEWNTPFVAPIGVTIADNQELLVTDAELGAVFRLDQEGKPVGKIEHESLKRPTGIAHDVATGLIYVADTKAHDIKVFSRYGQLQHTIGQPGTEPGAFNAPTHIDFVDNRLYVVDTLNARVQTLTPQGKPLSTVGERGLYVGNLTHPKGVAVDNDGNVYVTESFYDYLLIYDENGQFLLPIGGTGADPGRFFLPAGLWMDRQERLYVADMFNGRVMVLQYLGG
jgi:DNA-binding beta-propeller fold protein YncE